MYKAYKLGQVTTNPADSWYKGELMFFDFYGKLSLWRRAIHDMCIALSSDVSPFMLLVIPLARKLKDCGVFGVSSDEYLQYALKNRSEWEAKGHECTEELIASFHNVYENTEQSH